MRRRSVFLPTTAALVCLVMAARARADAFDNYTNPLLIKAVEGDGVKEVKQLTSDLISDNDRVVPGANGTVLVLRTNEGRHCKMIVHEARQKTDADHSVPMLLIDRYVAFKEGEERTVKASGQNLYVFGGFRVSFDLGQVVPEALGGDLRFVADGDKTYAEPVGKAKLYLLTRHLAEASPKKGPKLVVGETFEPRYFNGTYKLVDDGKRSGKLVLKVDDDGVVTGSYYSDKDGSKYDVRGRVGTPTHSISFTVQLPRTEQTFQGWLFTGDGQILTGSSRMNEREAGFYATRIDD